MRSIILLLFLCFVLCQGVVAQSVDSKTPKQAYRELLQQEQNIKNEIESITQTLPSLKGSKAKKATKRLNELSEMQDAIQRTKQYFPESVTSQQPEPTIDDAAREQVRQMIQQKYLAKGGTMEDADEEQHETAAVVESYWSIALSISEKPDKSKFKGYDVEMERMGGRYIFFTGRYSTKSEADSRCRQIVKKGKYRDAFVVQRNK